MAMIQLNALRLNAVDANIIALDGVRRRGSHAGAPPVVPDVPEEPDVPTNPDVDENGYIIFADPEVARICADNWGDGTGITLEQAASVTSIGQTFSGNAQITKFNELRHFLGLTAIFGTHLANGGAFRNCTSLSEVSIPASVTEISNGAFNGCISLETVGDMKNITKIGNSSFINCSEMRGVVVLPNLETLGSSSFEKTGITGVIELGRITTINAAGLYNQGDFYGCKNLRYAILPPTITSVGKSSFGGNNNLEVVVCKSDVVPAMSNGLAFNDSPNALIYVPSASVEAYRTATNWSTYASRIFPVSQLQTDNPAIYEEIEEYL